MPYTEEKNNLLFKRCIHHQHYNKRLNLFKVQPRYSNVSLSFSHKIHPDVPGPVGDASLIHLQSIKLKVEWLLARRIFHLN